MRETTVRKQVSDFFEGKQASGNRCLDMVPGNRCRETGVLIPFGNRCRETGVLIPFGNRCLEINCLETVVWIQLSLSIECLETDVKVSNVTCTYGEKVSGCKCPGNSCLGNR